MERPTVIEGRCWVILDKEGKPITDIDTDQIYHNAYLAITDIAEMGRYAFSSLAGWEDFPKKASPGDIIVAGANFGAGSSRQQAVDCFISLGIALIIAESFGAIYKRNAINSGFPILTAPGIMNSGLVATGDVLRVDLVSGRIFNVSRNEEVPGGKPFSRVQLEIYRAGNLFAYGKKLFK
ncbi:MAG: 3-isopropylmalate dehydratase [Acidobacteria bacterium]|nr:3-isopropylmalate dehydratase [Acidobacteriota bacterium]